MHLEGACITCSSCVKVLGMTVDFDLKFDKHISDLGDKVSKKINALCQVTGYAFRKTKDCNENVC